MDLSSYDFNILLQKASEYSGEIFGLISATTAPLISRLKVLRNYQFGIPSVFNLFAFLFAIPVFIYVWSGSEPSINLYNTFSIFSALGVIFIFISFFNGFCCKGTQVGHVCHLALTGFSLIMYAIGIGLIVFSINFILKLNNYYIFSGKIFFYQKNESIENRDVYLIIGGSQRGRKHAVTDKDGGYVFFLHREQLCFLNKVEYFQEERKNTKFKIIDLWPGLQQTCINEIEPTSIPAKHYQFQQVLEI